MTEHLNDLVARASRGELPAVELLLARYLPGLRAFIRLRAGALVRQKESTSDLAQSVCREILQHAERFQFQGEAGFKHWLYATALRKICNRHEYYGAGKRDAAKEVSLDQTASTPGDDQLLQCYRRFYTPSQQAMMREELGRVELAFERLPEEYREVIVLARVVGLTRAEIAERMGRSEGAVRTLLSRALAQLAHLVERGNEQTS
ncbi:MAG: sigma-70 family RNA polymerase sigma factor [Planctomycetota bacterium]